MEPVTELDRAWGVRSAGPQLRRVRRAAEALRERLLAGPRVVAVRTFPLVALPYPARLAFGGAALSPAPLVTVTHRCVLVQFLAGGELRNLLFEPTAVESARALPLLARAGERLFAKRFETLEQQLAHEGLVPADIDWLAFDSLQLQDLRGLDARFPNAKLLVAEEAWSDLDDLHPVQRAWHVRDGKAPAALSFTSGDVMLGDGVLLLRTPGRAPGAQSLFLNTSHGIWGVSGNGTSADAWAPHESKVAGVASVAERFDLEVLPGSIAPDLGLPYTSMVLERTLADRVARAPAFVQILPTSEVTPTLLAPGLGPTIVHEAITDGAVVRPRARAHG